MQRLCRYGCCIVGLLCETKENRPVRPVAPVSPATEKKRLQLGNSSGTLHAADV